MVLPTPGSSACLELPSWEVGDSWGRNKPTLPAASKPHHTSSSAHPLELPPPTLPTLSCTGEEAEGQPGEQVHMGLGYGL